MKILKKITTLVSSLTLASGLSIALSPSALANEPFLGEIKMVGFNFAPRGWAFTDGQLLPIASNTALFSLLGTVYGGDGRTTFALPDLRGRVAVHPGRGPGLSEVRVGQKGGREFVTLTTANMPTHSHSAITTVTDITATLNGTNGRGNSSAPEASSLASKSRTDIYSSAAPDVAMHADSITVTADASTTIGNTGGNQSFDIRTPYLGIYHVIALQGIYPSRS